MVCKAKNVGVIWFYFFFPTLSPSPLLILFPCQMKSIRNKKKKTKALVSYCDCSTNKKRNGKLSFPYTCTQQQRKTMHDASNARDNINRTERQDEARKMPKEQIILCVKPDDDDSTIEQCLWKWKRQTFSAKDSHRVAKRFSFENWLCVYLFVFMSKTTQFLWKKTDHGNSIWTGQERTLYSLTFILTMITFHTLTSSYMRQMIHFTWCEIGRKCVRKIDGSKELSGGQQHK